MYLFGSRVDGVLGPISDYDLAVWTDQQSDRSELHTRQVHEMVLRLGTERVDLVILNDAPIELAYHVIAQGRILYERDLATRVEYEAQVMGLYGDYLPVLRAQRTEI